MLENLLSLRLWLLFYWWKKNRIIVDISNPSWKSSVNRCLLKAILCNLRLLMFLLDPDLSKFEGQLFLSDVWKPVETTCCEKSWGRNEDPVFMLASNTYTEKSVTLLQNCIFWSKHRRCLYFKVAMQGKQHQSFIKLEAHFKDSMNSFPDCGTLRNFSKKWGKFYVKKKNLRKLTLCYALS